MKHNYIKSMLAAMLLLCSTVASAHDFEVDGIYYIITNATAKTVGVSYSPDDSYSGDVVIPDKVTYKGTTYSVTSIYGYAFDGCTGLTSVTIPNSVNIIGDNAFYGCSRLTAVHISDLAAWCGIDFGSNPLSYAHNLYLNGEKVTDLVIPYGITSIGKSAFYGCSGLTSVTIPNSVESIGSYAFRDCTGLNSVTIPNSVTSIGSHAFDGCSGLTSITIPNSVTSIGESAFVYCTGLTSIVIPNSLTSIGSYAFRHCSGLTSITVNSGNRIYDSRGCNAIIETATNTLILGCKNTKIPNSVTTIGYNAFNGCTGLTNIKIPDSVTSIGENAFYDCSGLTSITIPNSVTSIGEYAFSRCRGLTSVTIGNGVTSIGSSAFESCTKLASVTIGEGVTSIGSNAFWFCTALTSIEIPNSVTSIGSYAFQYCSGLTGIIIYSGSIGSYAFEDCTKLASVTIGEGVTSIESKAFYGCKNLKTVYNYSSLNIVAGNTGNGYVAYYADKVINARFDESDFVFDIIDGVNTLIEYTGDGGDITLPEKYYGKNYVIGSSAFYGCSRLTSVTIPAGVTAIGYKAFEDCTGLTSVTIPNSVTGIGAEAFSRCRGLTSVTIPNSVTSIGGGAFLYCDDLTAVHINDLAAWCRIDFSGCYFNPIYHSHNLYLNGEKVTDLVIPSDITEIKQFAFDGCTGLTSVTIPNSVTSIGGYAFRNCTGLASIEIPNSVTSIGEGAFEGCSGLTSVTIPNSVTTIGNGTFSGCRGLKSITIPNSVTSIGEDAFENCSSLTSVTIGNSVTSIGEGAFEGCSGLTSITIPNGVTSIGGYAFRNCTGLTSVTIGNSVTSIGSYAFYGCSGLTSVTIPNSVTSIGGYAFRNCTGLTGIIINSGSIGSYAFDGCTKLASVTIGEGVTSIGSYAFQYCRGLTAVHISDLAAWCRIYFSDDYSNPLYYAHNLYLNGEKVTDLVIPDGVTEINSYAFYDCTGLTSITIPNSVTSIEWGAFYRCENLKTVYNYSTLNIVKGSTDNGYVAYYADKIINAPNGSVEGNFVFERTKVTSLQFTTANGLPGTVTGSNHIWESPVINCSTNGVRITVLATDAPDSYNGYPIVALGELEFYDGNGNKIEYSASNVTTNSLESTEGSLAGLCDGDYSTFYHSTWQNGTTPDDYVYLDIKFPQTVDAFKIKMVGRDTKSLVPTEINVAPTGGEAIISNNSLVGYTGNDTELVLPENCNGENYVIAADVFKNNTAITSVTIPAGVTAIGDNAFSGCENLKTVTNKSSLNIVAGSTDNGYVAYYADKVITINADGSSNGVIGDYKFTSANGVNTLVEYLGNSKEITPDSWTSTNAGVNSSTSKNTWTINAQAGDILTFDWRVSSESNYDKLIVTIDGREILNESGEGSDNYTHTFENADTYTLVAKYTKDGSNSNGDDCASISNVKIASNGNVSIALVLPENYNGENYVIAADVFRNNTAITGVTIPNGVTSIGYCAFSGCTGLASVTIGNSVTSIGEGAFYDCTGLTSVTIGNSVTNIGGWAFQGCTGLTGVTIPNSVTSIGNNAFCVCTGLASVTIPAGVTAIGDNAFYGCSSLTSVTIPNSVTSIGNSAFYDCSSLTAVHINDLAAWCRIDFGYSSNPLSYAHNLYLNGEKVTDLVIPGDVTEIKARAFHGCTGLASVTIPEGVTAIGDNAFYGCENLKTVTNNSSLNIVLGSTDNGYVAYYADKVINADGSSVEGDFVFARTKVTSLQFTTANGLPGTVTGSNHIWESPVINCSTNGVRITVFATNVSDSYNGYPIVALGELEFYDGNGNKINYTASDVTTNSLESTEGSLAGLCDGDYSTYYHSTWRSGTVPDDYVYLDIKFSQTVDAFKFKMVSRDTKRCVPTEINVAPTGGEAIISNNSLVGYTGNDTELVLPENCNGENYVIAADVFKNNTAITSVTIPNSVTSIGDDAFYGCESLKTVTNNSSLNIVLGNTNNGYVAYYADEIITVNADGSTIVTQGDYRFTTANGINTLVEYLGDGGDVTLPENYNGESYQIGDLVFKGCTNLTSVTIGNSVTSIGNSAFYGCTGLTSVTIGNSVTNIGEWAFYGCSSLTSVTIPNSVTSIGGGAFLYCTGLTAVHINDLAAWCRIDFGFNPLFHAHNLYLNGEKVTDLVIPNSVTSIGSYAFGYCTGLTSIEIPNSVTSIGDEAFYYCTGLKEIYSLAKTPPTINSSTFNDYSATLYVPYGTKSAYQAANYWKNFTNIVEMESDALPGDVNGDSRVSVADITTVVDAILNESTDTAYDVNGDSRVSVADITTIVDIILNEGASSASKAPARVATRSSSNLSLYIDPFEIEAGEEKEILVNLSNAGTEITAVEFDLFLPEGLEVVSDEYGYYISPGSRTPNKRNPHAVSGALLSSGAIHVICYHNSQLAFTGEDGDVVVITIKAADDLEPGNYTIDLRNIEIVNPADPTNGILISDNNTVVTDIEQIEAEEGTTEIYDLNGRKVAEPVKGGIYIINGKKVVVNK